MFSFNKIYFAIIIYVYRNRRTPTFMIVAFFRRFSHLSVAVCCVQAHLRTSAFTHTHTDSLRNRVHADASCVCALTRVGGHFAVHRATNTDPICVLRTNVSCTQRHVTRAMSTSKIWKKRRFFFRTRIGNLREILTILFRKCKCNARKFNVIGPVDWHFLISFHWSAFILFGQCT